MVDIQSATAEIRRGKKEERRRNLETTGRKYLYASATPGGHNYIALIVHDMALRRYAEQNTDIGLAALGRVANPRPITTIKTGRVAQPITDAF